ncbi:MAG: HDOD domain-containing protein [Gammaproteobacteria bacterium]
MEALVENICQAISHNRLNLPPLPETCLKVRTLLQHDNCSARQLANVIAVDTALSARIMKVANSALYARAQSAGELHTAVQRLGNRLVGSLVNGLAIMPLFSAAQKQHQETASQIRQHSTATAALAYALCQRHKHLNVFESYIIAMLQNIGCTAILSYPGLPPQLSADPGTLHAFMVAQHIPIGSHLLRHWQFPASLIETQQKHQHFFHTHSNRVNYLDIIVAANAINGPLFPAQARATPAYSHIPALQRLHITEASLEVDMRTLTQGIQEARYIFQTT